MKKCIIVGAGDFYGMESPAPGDYIIAADAGYDYLAGLGIKPHLVMGDFDSRGKAPDIENVIRFKKEKDDTDIGLAIKYAHEKGFDEFHIYGGTGGRRFSHTLANIQNLAGAALLGCVGYLYGRHEITLVDSLHSVEFSGECSGMISLFALSDRVSGVNISGLKYELSDYDLKNTMPLGVSNEFTGKKGKISVSSGVYAVVTACENFPFITVC